MLDKLPSYSPVVISLDLKCKMSELWLCFPCCVTQQPPPRRKRIDRSMIGEPMNFKHTGHIGSGDMASGSELGSVQVQMQSKGGYQGISVPVHVTPAGIPVGGGN